MNPRKFFEKFKAFLELIIGFFFYHFLRKKKQNFLENNGFLKMPSFLSESEIKKIKKEINLAISVQSPSKFMGTHEIKRYGAINEAGPSTKNFCENKKLKKIAKEFFGVSVENFFRFMDEEKKKSLKEVRPKNETTLNFHFDRQFGVFKVLLFLDKIDYKKGPFQIVKGSHRLSYGNFKMKSKKIIKYFAKLIFKRSHNIDESEYDNYFSKKDIHTCVGNKGDVYIVNTCAYHRATNCQSGNVRKILWIYHYDYNFITRLKKLCLKK